MKKIIALIMALVMVMGLAITASAAGISIDLNAQAGANTSGITYHAVKIFDAEVIDGGVTYSLPNDNSALTNALLANVDRPKTNGGTDFYFTKTLSADGSKYYIVPTELALNEKAETLAWHMTSHGGKGPAIEIPYVEAEGAFINESLDPGYYYVYSNVGGNSIVQTLGETVEITNKNEYPTVTKKVNGEDSVTVDEGNEVTFTVEIKLPSKNNIPTWKLTLHDENEGVTIDEESVTITVDGEDVSGHVVKEEYHAHCHEFDLTFSYTVTSYVGKTIVVTYTGTVNALTEDATNTAWISIHGDDPNNPFYESVKDTVTMSNAKISIFKYTPGEQNAKTALPGAGFVIAKKDAQGNITHYYQLDDQGVVNWVTEIAQATEHVSAADGNVPAFEGLAEGDYYIVEKTVPAGYNKAADTKITIGTETKDGVAVAKDMSAEVVNNTGSQLPSTGGIGTTLFYVIGGLMMTGAAVVLITKKRMSV